MPTATHELACTCHPLGDREEARRALHDEGSRRPDALLGSWSAETGSLNRIVTLWAYDAPAPAFETPVDDWLSPREVRQQMVVRRAVATRDPAWAAYRQKIRPMLAAMHSTLLVLAP